jgi:hypothetical protein
MKTALDSMLDTWEEEFGRAAWLPVLKGNRHARARATILKVIRKDDTPISASDIGRATLPQFRLEVAPVFGIDTRQKPYQIDEDILAAFHRAELARDTEKREKRRFSSP